MSWAAPSSSIQDKKTGLLTLSVIWTDADTSAEWANLLVKRVNDRLRGQALAEAGRNIEYLQREMDYAHFIWPQQTSDERKEAAASMREKREPDFKKLKKKKAG